MTMVQSILKRMGLFNHTLGIFITATFGREMHLLPN
jgi:hypothetical protein